MSYSNDKMSRKERRAIAFNPKTTLQLAHHSRTGKEMLRGVQDKPESIGQIVEVQVGTRKSRSGVEYPVFKKMLAKPKK